jgi:hypothetical protein
MADTGISSEELPYLLVLLLVADCLFKKFKTDSIKSLNQGSFYWLEVNLLNDTLITLPSE